MRRMAKPAVNPRFQVRENLEAKIWDVEPPESIVKELRDHTIKTGRPDEWRFHCHSLPLGSEAPKIIAIGIDVPEKFRAEVGRAPCPLCSLHGPRFFQGMLAWWKDEKALRVIGHECGSRWYGESFANAKRDYLRRVNDAEALDNLIESLPKVPRMLAWIEGAQPQARKIDAVRKRLLGGLSKKCSYQLFDNIGSDGNAKLYEVVFEPIYGRAGLPVLNNMGEPLKRAVSVASAGIPIAGRDTLKHPKTVEILLYRALLDLTAFGPVEADSVEDLLIRWGEDGRIENAKRITQAFALCRAAHKLAGDIQQFITSNNLDNICTFASDQRAPFAVHIKRERFGRYEVGSGKKSQIVITETPELRAIFPLPPF